jgi:hypothetical protein
MNTATATTSTPVRWRVIGWRESVYQSAPGEPWRAGSTCEKCGQAIRYVVTLKSTDGHVLNVGQDCAVTLKGGPELAEIRRAERAYEEEQYRKSPEYAARVERERRQKSEREGRAARAEVDHGYELAGLRAILSSPNTSTFEKDHAIGRRDRILSGHEVFDLDETQRSILSVAVAKAFLPTARYAGQPGEKCLTRYALFEAMIQIESLAYGTSWIHKFRATDGSVLVWKTKACDLRRDDLGAWVTVRGTVKEHREFRGEPQTALTRCKVTVESRF